MVLTVNSSYCFFCYCCYIARNISVTTKFRVHSHIDFFGANEKNNKIKQQTIHIAFKIREKTKISSVIDVTQIHKMLTHVCHNTIDTTYTINHDSYEWNIFFLFFLCFPVDKSHMSYNYFSCDIN